MRIPAVGQDGGVDIICLQPNHHGSSGYKWLVSCKHNAHSGRSVGQGDDEANVNKLYEHGCHGFMFVYSTTVAESLRNSVEKICKNTNSSYHFFLAPDIENNLIRSPRFYPLIKQFFPKSYERLIGAINTGANCCPDGNSYPNTTYIVYFRDNKTYEIKVKIIGECCRERYVEHFRKFGIEYSYNIFEEHY